MAAWRDNENGTIRLDTRGVTRDALTYRLPCGGCIGCRTARARAWSLRCHLENQQHATAAFTTLTYSDEHVPPTLEKRHLGLWLKRLRFRLGPTRPIRFFASGEYGETTGRPHFHALVFGASQRDHALIEDTWQFGHARTEAVNSARISYVAGYCSKKIGWAKYAAEHERVDPNTGEVYTWQPPFVQMSRRPGIGATARAFTNSWRMYAILNGYRIPVPRYLHEAWLASATPAQKEELHHEKWKITKEKDHSTARLEAGEQIAIAKQKQSALKRKY